MAGVYGMGHFGLCDTGLVMQPRSIVGGYEWQSPEKAAEYLAREKEAEREAEFRSAHEYMLGLLPVATDAAFQFLDLGAGHGAVSASVMSRFPKATGILADMSAPMMQAGSDVLAPFAGRYRYVEYDMNSEAWPAELAGPFQAAVSARAIHHLPNERKRTLYQQILDALAPGGVFVNWDLFPPPGRVLDPENNAHDRTAATIEQQVEMLQSAGFADVAASRVVRRRAVFFGRKL
jgi:SAM-dependent methyltransferase